MKKKTYLQLQIKRTAKLYPAILVITMITVLSIALVAAVMLYNNKNSSDKTKIRIGIVGDTTETYLGIGIAALENFDSSRFSIDFYEVNEQEAQEMLKKHELSGYVLIPDDFVQGIVRGKNVPAEYVMLNDSTGFETILMSEVASIVSDWVTRSQGAIYGMQNLAYDYGYKYNVIQKYTNSLNTSYIENIIGRDNTYETVSTGIVDAISGEGYYICGILMFFLLIWGISCNKLLIKKNFAMARSLYARGIKTWWQVICEFLGFFIFTMLTLIILAIIFGVVVQNNDFGVRELKGVGIFECIAFVFKISPVVLMTTLMQMMMYEMTSGTVNAIVFQFLTAVVLAYISGCFYPNSFFPDGVQKFASLLPSGVGFSYMRKSITGISVLSDLGVIVIYIAAFLSLTVFIRKYRMEGDEQ